LDQLLYRNQTTHNPKFTFLHQYLSF